MGGTDGIMDEGQEAWRKREKKIRKGRNMNRLGDKPA
jgi:hypothetical protein